MPYLLIKLIIIGRAASDVIESTNAYLIGATGNSDLELKFKMHSISVG